jgi:hypothetical protein
VVLNHEFLSRRSALDASVTVGRVSGFKIDLTDRRVIQTDAAITWGNSGGPAFTLRGEVIGAATFISTTAEGDQAIQGFNFLIPVETLHEFARGISLTPTADSPFMREWEQAVTAEFQGNHARAIRHVEAADRILPGLPDVQRLRAEAQLGGEREPVLIQRNLAVGVGLGAGVGLALLILGLRHVVKRQLRRWRGRVERISPEEVRRRLETGTVLTLVDARRGMKFDASPGQVAGALRYDVERSTPQPHQMQVTPNGEVVVYCD